MVLLHFSGRYWGSKFKSSRCRVSAVLAEPSWEMPCVLSPLLGSKQPKLVVRLAVIYFSLVRNWITRFCWSELTRITSLSCRFGQNFKGKTTKGTGILSLCLGHLPCIMVGPVAKPWAWKGTSQGIQTGAHASYLIPHSSFATHQRMSIHQRSL